MKTRMLIATLVGSAVLVPAGALAAAPSKGVVVDFRAHSKTATVATTSGRLVAVHTAKRVRVGSVVKVKSARTLRNGTFSATLVKVGKARHARVRGTVVSRVGKSIMLSARGTTFAIRLRGARTMDMTATPPVGSTVSVDVTIKDNGALDADEVNELTPPTPGQTIEVEGKLTASSPTSLTVTTRDDGVTTEFVIAVPAGTDVSALVLNSEVELQVLVNADGTFTLAQGAMNGDDNEADDEGDDVEHHGIYDDGGHHGGDA